MKPWVHLDKLLWQFMRWATKFTLKPLIFLGITPNQLTVFSSVINFTAAVFCFARGEYWWNMVGLLFLLLHSYFDFADGTLARATGKISKNGAWLDSRLDLIGAEAVIIGISFGIISHNPVFIWMIIIFLTIFSRLGLLAVVFDYDKTIYSKNHLEFWQRFRQDPKMTIIDKIIKDFITFESFPFLFFGTFRYFLPLMILINQLTFFIIITALFNNLRWVIMFWAYAQALNGQKSKLRVINLLSKYIKA